jgi:hypothetical protein
LIFQQKSDDMTRVFLLEHLHILNDEEENVKTLGIYSSRAAALSAVERFRVLPGFIDYPQFADTTSLGRAEGFYLDEYEIDQDSWHDGFVTV